MMRAPSQRRGMTLVEIMIALVLLERIGRSLGDRDQRPGGQIVRRAVVRSWPIRRGNDRS